MNVQLNSTLKSQASGVKENAGKRVSSGFPVQSGIQAGAWRCSDCQGQVSGNQMTQPTCSYCTAA